MSDLRATIVARVDAFLRELEAFARDAALAAARDALRAAGDADARGGAASSGTQRRRGRNPAKGVKRRRVAQRRAGRGGRRPGTIRERVLRALADGGAMGRSQVAKAIGVSPKAVEAPLRDLFRAGRVARTGTSAQTAYAAKK